MLTFGTLPGVRVQRHSEIVARVRDVGTVSVSELSSALDVSPSTIRRDLQQLDRAGVLTRVHGGAAVTTGDPDRLHPFDDVARAHAEAKARVAVAAAARVRDGEVVALDIGTTTARLARELRGRAITVVTNSLAVLDALRDDESVELILLGGMLRRSYHSLVGVLTEDAVHQIGVDRAFIGTSGIASGGQVMDSTLVEVTVKRAFIAAAREVVVVADGHKIPGSGTLRVCRVDQVDVLVTSAGADPLILDECRDRGVEVEVA
ncbi:DeoR family transcriptional regulator [Knoellia flava]|uniref:DeoR family transcriptional regulator n=1 Tax=Knoellia flava TaxID=913969 RepID=A0A8H9FTQ6_9MICO|nr:DeoR family transcriptional regulator [Knoellia flava]